MGERKGRFGDRRDGVLLRDLDSMHVIMPMIFPNRCDNEAYIAERIELNAINAYLEGKNAGEAEFKYTLFHVIVAALIKTVTLRPKLNRFIANQNMYQRKGVSASFVVKKRFADDAGEALAFVRAKEDDTIDSLHQNLFKQISGCRSDKKDTTSGSMDLVCKLPRPLLKVFVAFVRFLDRRGLCPRSFTATDPYYSSVILTNLGSIKLKSGYHHLTNWGTTSIFCVVGEKKKGTVETVDLGLTIDERLADGYYYAKSVRLLKHLLAHPELLERPLSEEVEY